MATMNLAAGRGERGQAVIELALTLPLLLLIVMGVFDFGLMFQRFEIVTNAAREGARVGILPSYTTGNAAQRALDYLAVGGLNGGLHTCGGALVADTRCATATVYPVVITGTVPPVTVNQITVTVEYDHRHVFVGPIMGLFGTALGTTRLKAVSTMRVE
jgi:Flp pilus assembly protein TadG